MISKVWEVQQYTLRASIEEYDTSKPRVRSSFVTYATTSQGGQRGT